MSKAVTEASQRPPTKKEQQEAEILRRIIRYKHLDRYSNKEIAALMHMSERTLYKKMSGPDYAAMVVEMRADWMESARTEVHSLAQEALQTMRELMSPETKSEHVRFEAAAKIGDWLGLAERPEEQGGVDGKEELERIFRILENHTQPPVMVFAPPTAGGFLPPAVTVTPVVEQVQGEVVEEEMTI